MTKTGMQTDWAMTNMCVLHNKQTLENHSLQQKIDARVSWGGGGQEKEHRAY